MDEAVGAIEHWLERFDVVVVGPGLGRDELVHDTVVKVLFNSQPMTLFHAVTGAQYGFTLLMGSGCACAPKRSCHNHVPNLVYRV